MKLLIAYDGSNCSEAAIDDLKMAGLPLSCEALVISVAEVWLPPPGETGYSPSDSYIEEIAARHREKSERAVQEARDLVQKAKARLAAAFPNWNIEAEATYGSPAWEILSAADSYRPDLIVIGSHGYSAIGRFFIGSISTKILTEARCSVRIARGKIDVDPGPVRVAIGFDVSKGAEYAVEAVAERNWPAGTIVRLISIGDPLMPKTIGSFVPPIKETLENINDSERNWIEDAAAAAILRLERSGLAADLRLVSGNPKRDIVEEAELWNADVIFVGANAFGSRLERFLIGSTSSAVATRASCSVEVVRR